MNKPKTYRKTHSITTPGAISTAKCPGNKISDLAIRLNWLRTQGKIDMTQLAKKLVANLDQQSNQSTKT